MAISKAPKHLQPWLRHLAAFRKKHPNMPFADQRAKASKSWAKKKKPVAKKPAGAKKPKRKTAAKKKPKKYYGNTKTPYLRGGPYKIDRFSVNKSEPYEKSKSERKLKTRYN